MPETAPPGRMEWLRSPKQRWVLYTAGLLCLAVAGLIVWLFFFTSPEAAPVLTAPAQIGTVEKTVLATGALVPFLQIDVGSRASGRVTSLMVAVGDRVQEGEVIADIDSATQLNNLNTARAALTDVKAQRAAAQANVEQAQPASDRASRLFALDAGSRESAEIALKALKGTKAVLTSISAQIVQATISVETARVNLGYTRIVAPFSGTVLVVAAKQGQTVNAAQNTPTIITLGRLDRMTVEAQIAEADVINVRPGMDVYFTVLGDPDHRYFGRLRSIEPAPNTYVSAAASTAPATAAAIYYNGLFDVDNSAGRLKTTMTANVSVIVQQAKSVLTIPSAALSDAAADGSYTVQILPDKGRAATSRRVVIGVNDGTKAEVKSGLAAGELVVVGVDSTAKSSAATPLPRAHVPGMPRTVGGL